MKETQKEWEERYSRWLEVEDNIRRQREQEAKEQYVLHRDSYNNLYRVYPDGRRAQVTGLL